MTGLFFFRNTRSHRVCAMWLLAGIAVGFAQDRDVRSARHIELKTERQRWAALADAKRLSQQAEKYEKQGNPDQAERMAEEALAMGEQGRRPRHIDPAPRLDQVADLYAARGKDRAAEPLYQR